MAKVNFTAGRVADFECDSGKSQCFLWDTSAPGLGLRVTANGAKAFMFQAKLNGQAMRITIGSPSIWTIEAAKIESRRLKVIIDNGQDPRQVKTDGLVAAQVIRDVQEAKKTAAATLAAKNSTTFKQVWDIYLQERKPHWGERH